MSAPYKNINRALETRLQSVIDIPVIFWPNSQKKPSKNEDWVRITNLGINGEFATISDYQRYSGVCQIDIFTQYDKGQSTLLTYAESIHDHFLSQKTLTEGGDRIHIQFPINVSQPRQDGAWWTCFIEINYLCYS